MGTSTRIRLQHLQNLFWSKSVVTETFDFMRTKKSHSLLNDILTICKQHEITFKLSTTIRENLLIKGGNITIEELLKDEDCYSQYRRGLRQRRLLFLEQLSSFDGKRLLHWQELKGNERRGPKPGWFKIIERQFMVSGTNRSIPNILKSQMVNRFNTCNWNIDKTSGDIK